MTSRPSRFELKTSDRGTFTGGSTGNDVEEEPNE